MQTQSHRIRPATASTYPFVLAQDGIAPLPVTLVHLN